METLSEKDQYQTWEEEMYWKYFYTMHFYQVLPKDFHDHLVLPPKFAEQMASKLPNKVCLVGPSGSAWTVEVSKTGNLALVGDGWKEFATAYNLEENLLVLCKYKQNSIFEVLIFDQRSLCEKESSYFVKKCLQKQPDINNSRKRNLSEAATTEVMEDNDGDGGSECAASKKPNNKGAAEQVVSVEVRNNHDGSECAVSKKPDNKGAAEQVVSVGIRNNPESPRACPSDASSEDFRNDPDFVVSNRIRNDITVEVINSGGRKSHQGSKSCVSNEVADAENGGRLNMVVVPCKSSVKSKAKSGKKPSANSTARNLTQFFELDVSEEIPTDNGESEPMEELIPISPDNCDVISDAVPIKAVNGEGPPGTNQSRKSGGKRGRSAKRALPKAARKYAFNKSANKRLSKEYVSHRRPVTVAETDDALRRANKALTERCFVMVMRPTCVYRRFYLVYETARLLKNIPAEWMNKYLPRRHQSVLLRVGEKTWETMFYFYSCRGSSGGLASGWKKFAIDNNLEEYDVCVFKPATIQKDAAVIVLDVEIFRVVEEITPLTPMICSI